jgi:hypothetical protein
MAFGPAISPTGYVRVHVMSLAAGFGTLFAAREFARWLNDPVGSGALRSLWISVPIVVSAVLVWRTVHVIVSSAFSDAHRVFRTRHLGVCALLLFVLAGGAAGAVFARGPFDTLLAHGVLTGEAIADAAILVSTVVCLLGGTVAASGAWERRNLERDWHRALDCPVPPAE